VSADPNKKSARSFQCRDVLWETFEQMARELECSVDYLINEAMKQYARQRSQGQRPGSQTGTPPPVRAEDIGRGRDQGGAGYGPPSGMGGGGGGLVPPQRMHTVQGMPPGPGASSGIGGGLGGPNRLPPPPMRNPTAPQGSSGIGGQGRGGGLGGGMGGGQGGLPAPPPRQMTTQGLGAPGGPAATLQDREGGGLAPPGYPSARTPYGQQQPGGTRPPPRSVPPPMPRPTPSPFAAQNAGAIGGLGGMGSQGGLTSPPPNNGYGAQLGQAGAQASSQAAQGQLAVIYQGDKLAVNKERFVIGRGKQSSDLTLKDPNVSRQHAMVEFQNGVYFMVDMGSTNGVEYNGQRIARKPIAEGDVFRICDHDLRFTYR
jgi:hypothetical protein